MSTMRDLINGGLQVNGEVELTIYDKTFVYAFLGTAMIGIHEQAILSGNERIPFSVPGAFNPHNNSFREGSLDMPLQPGELHAQARAIWTGGFRKRMRID